MTTSRVAICFLSLMFFGLPGAPADGQDRRAGPTRPTLLTVPAKTINLAQEYACRISSGRQIEVRAPADGQIRTTWVEEGQAVKEGELLFRIDPVQVKEKPTDPNPDQVAYIRAPFAGLAGALPRQQGSLVLKGETLTTLFDNSVMWVYFEMPEVRYLDYMRDSDESRQNTEFALFLADGSKFPQAGKLGAIMAQFCSETGNISFRADFPNPGDLLRNGQRGKIVLTRLLKNALVIPQRATFEQASKRYVFIVDSDQTAHQREVAVEAEIADDFIITYGLKAGDRIVLDEVRIVHDGMKLD